MLAALTECVEQLTGEAVVLTFIPGSCPLVDLEQHGLSIDSIQLLELVVLLEEHLGVELELPDVDDDWLTYTWSRLVDDLTDAARRATG